MTDVAQIVASTAEVAFASDLSGVVVAWGGACESLLGYRSRDAVGTRCYELLRGRDVFGNRFCARQCPIRAMVASDEAIHHFDAWVSTAANEQLLTRVVPFVTHDDENGPTVIHILEPVVDIEPSANPTSRATTSESPACGGRFAELTERERQILELLIAGRGTREIGDELFISAATVRSHIQSILRKTETHSRLEVVALANR